MDPFDLSSIFALRARWETLDRSVAPTIALVGTPGECRSVALLPGSFNPPTAAHLLLAERALREGFDCVVLLLARNTVGKEPSGLIPEDRLLAMHAASSGSFAVGACSHGLYADQAEAAASMYPKAELTFLVGSDKVVQIFDRQWYDDRDGALERLFERARLVVAPRSDQGDLLRDVLGAPENRRWSDSVEVLRLHPAVSDLSSTRVRGLLRAGAEPAGLVPSAVADLLSAIRAFAPPIVLGRDEVDVYALRAKMIDLCWSSRVDTSGVDLRHLIDSALSPTPAGARIRAAVASGNAHLDDLTRARAAGL
jgi:nicotinic acid mononucleotide adenylyltransferase